VIDILRDGYFPIPIVKLIQHCVNPLSVHNALPLQHAHQLHPLQETIFIPVDHLKAFHDLVKQRLFVQTPPSNNGY
jgi:hypothetical protein